MTRDASGVPTPDDATDPVICDKLTQRSRKGGKARMAAMSPEERWALSQSAADAHWGPHRAALAAQGKTPRPSAAPIAPDVLAYWKDVIRAEQPDRVWTSAMQFKRAAIKRARQEQARMLLEAAKNRGAE